jgi:serine/threonine-protein kinase
MTPETLNSRYQLEEHLGSGASSNVYRAKDWILERSVAVKVLAEHLSDDMAFVERFKREALAVAALIHPNIVQIYDVGVDEGRHYLVMAYVEGSSLEALIAQGSIESEQAVDLIAQAAAGLDHIHARGFIHRDVKPANMIVRPDPEQSSGLHVNVSDFGIAHHSMQPEVAGETAGTRGYLCPEAWRGEEATAQFDVYALAVVAHQLLVGDYPVRTRTGTLATDSKHALSREMLHALEHGLHDEPEQRARGCGEFALGLREAAIMKDAPET